MKITVHDPGNRLPREFRSSLPKAVHGTLLVPDHGVPIHPASAERFLSRISQDKSLCFTPEIPVASQLGLPKYEPLIYWYPDRETTLPMWQRLVGRMHLPGRTAPGLSGTSKPEALTETNPVERLHYFVSHLNAISPKPAQVSIVVSNVCNLKCVMCPYHSPQIKPTHSTKFFEEKTWMAWDMMDRIASECGSLRTPVKMGNIEEPLLHPQIVDFIQACRSRGVPSVHITSNGAALTPELSRRLLEAGLTSLYISIDAARPETYKRIRGALLDRVETNVRAFLQTRRDMGASCTVMVSFVKNQGVSADEVREFQDRWLKNTEGIILYNLGEYEVGSARFNELNPVAREKLHQTKGRWPCLNPWQEMYLLPDGRVYYCCETISKLAFEELESMGSYPDQSLTEIWQGEAFRALRRDLIEGELTRWPACDACRIWMAHATSTTENEGIRTTTNMITEVVQWLSK